MALNTSMSEMVIEQMQEEGRETVLMLGGEKELNSSEDRVKEGIEEFSLS